MWTPQLNQLWRICQSTVLNRKWISSMEAIQRESKYVAHNYHPLPVVLQKGRGIFMWDMDGKRYFDYLSGYSANNFGHCHPRICHALHQQSNQLHHTSRAFHSDVFGEYAQRACELFAYDKLLPMNTGCEAAETACKLARKWAYTTGRTAPNQAKIVCADGNFWGRSLAAISASTDPQSYRNYGPYMPGFEAVPYGDVVALETCLARDAQHICAVMLEPVQGEAGVVVPPDGYLTAVRQLCTEHNVLWLADEIQTGLGRCGRLLAVDDEAVRPDILILGKALGGGVYPVSACLANDAIMSVMEAGTHGSTFGGNPLASRVALAALDVLEEENCAQNAHALGAIFRAELRRTVLMPATGRRGVCLEVRGKGLLNAIVVNSDVVNAWTVCLKLMGNGVLAKNTNENVIRLAPPLIITEEQLLESLQVVIRVINEFDTV